MTTKPGKWAKLFHSKLHNIVPSWVSKQYNRSLFKTKLFFSLENELKAALVKLYSVKWQIRIMEYLKSMSASTISMWWPSYQIIRWCQFSEKGIVEKKKPFKMKKKQNPHKPLTKQQKRSLPYFLPKSFYTYTNVIFAAYCRSEYNLGHSLTELIGISLCSLVDKFRQGGFG